MNEVKLSDIIPAPWNARGEITPESVAELAQTIREQGLLQPIVIWKDGDGRMVCIAGNRRLAALKEIGAELEEGDTVIYDGDEAGARMITITENLQRERIGIVEEADAVCALLDGGKTEKEVADMVGRKPSWVANRRKIATLADGWRRRAHEIDDRTIEKISAYPMEVQEKLAKTMQTQTRWVDMKWYFEREMRDLDAVKFCTKDCRKCANRTGAMGDLFGDFDKGDRLGNCLDCKCFDKRLEEWKDDLIAKATKGVAEVIRCDYDWQMPGDDETTEKPDAEHPCAYVIADGDGVNVRYGESAAEREAREEAERKRRDAERAKDDEERAREDGIVDALEAWKSSGSEDELPVGLYEIVSECISGGISKEAADYCREKIVRGIVGWHDSEEWARLLVTFPKIAPLAGLTDDDQKYLVERNKGDN